MGKTVIEKGKFYVVSQSDCDHPDFGRVDVFDRFLALQDFIGERRYNTSVNHIKVFQIKTGKTGTVDPDLLCEASK